MNQIHDGGFRRFGQIGDDRLNLFQQPKSWRVIGLWSSGLGHGERVDAEQDHEYKADQDVPQASHPMPPRMIVHRRKWRSLVSEVLFSQDVQEKRGERYRKVFEYLELRPVSPRLTPNWRSEISRIQRQPAQDQPVVQS